MSGPALVSAAGPETELATRACSGDAGRGASAVATVAAGVPAAEPSFGSAGGTSVRGCSRAGGRTASCSRTRSRGQVLVDRDQLLQAVHLHQLVDIGVGVLVGGGILVLHLRHQQLQKIVGGNGGRVVVESKWLWNRPAPAPPGQPWYLAAVRVPTRPPDRPWPPDAPAAAGSA